MKHRRASNLSGRPAQWSTSVRRAGSATPRAIDRVRRRRLPEPDSNCHPTRSRYRAPVGESWLPGRDRTRDTVGQTKADGVISSPSPARFRTPPNRRCLMNSEPLRHVTDSARSSKSPASPAWPSRRPRYRPGRPAEFAGIWEVVVPRSRKWVLLGVRRNGITIGGGGGSGLVRHLGRCDTCGECRTRARGSADDRHQVPPLVPALAGPAASRTTGA